MEEVEAIVSYPPTSGPDWRLERIKFSRPLQSHELRVRMVATGICHTDIALSSLPPGMMGVEYPKILGHEGAGFVEEVGSDVKAARPGDPVLLSFNYCGDCELCKEQRQPYCLSFDRLNRIGDNSVYQSSTGEAIYGKFFGQSSFAAAAVVQEASVVNVRGLVSNRDDLKLLAPLGCGLMTGAGAVLNSAAPTQHDIVLVTGLGAVGMGAIMAAKVLGCREIIAVDIVAERLEVAKDLGATQVVESTGSPSQMVEAVRRSVQDRRISYVVETTGMSSVIGWALQALGRPGKLILVGLPRPGTELGLQLSDFFDMRTTIETHLLGHSTSQSLIPTLLQWWKDGKFPVQRIVRFFPASGVTEAIQETKRGNVIKAVVVW
ncbi:uncharacterized protein PV07_04833 [Cladophialophora immunda]|uniref:Enoyl reductase (ER) domain-containing protein n=1 Tax=Cladophialophora immunda TaxID=569365 RepID=A0A0D2AUR6_9EURO|nr:uncharacterized protein PV07_04833 [Cladophialophora immunda]KIW28982.1 hypothetical protein PV07_04833 [Cladophialophora immunda]